MPGTDSDSAPLKIPPKFQWDVITFKVGDRLFRVARQELVKESPVFESMFSLPDGDGPENVEGQTDDNPIALEGYEPEDFEALLRLLYPTLDDLIKGSIDLTKSQWIGALKLSTIWEMEKARKLSILTLSTASFNLTPIEKITLAREHRVGRWLEEGLTSLVRGDLDLSLDDLETGVGLRTAFRILGMRTKNAERHNLRFMQVAGKSYPTVALGRLLCPSQCGNSSAFLSPLRCSSCKEEVPSLENGHVIILDSTKLEVRVQSEPPLVYLSIQVHNLEHTGCRGPLVAGAIFWSCECEGDPWNVIFPLGPSGASATEIDMIRSTFADEFKDLGH